MVTFQRVILGGDMKKLLSWPYRPLSLYAFFVLRLLPCRQLTNTLQNKDDEFQVNPQVWFYLEFTEVISMHLFIQDV